MRQLGPGSMYARPGPSGTLGYVPAGSAYARPGPPGTLGYAPFPARLMYAHGPSIYPPVAAMRYEFLDVLDFQKN